MTVTTGAPPASATAKQRAALELARRRTALQVSTLARAVVDIDDTVGWDRLTELGTRSTVTAQQSATVATTDLLNATLNAADLVGDITSLPGINPGRLASGKDVRGMFAMTRQVVSNRMLGGATFAEGLDASANKLVAIAASEPHRIARDGQLAVGLADERFNRYRRVARGVTCQFCLMLATRGAVYLTAQSAGEGRRYHANCDCSIVVELNAAAVKSKPVPFSDLAPDWRNAILDKGRLNAADIRREWANLPDAEVALAAAQGSREAIAEMAKRTAFDIANPTGVTAEAQAMSWQRGASGAPLERSTLTRIAPEELRVEDFATWRYPPEQVASEIERFRGNAYAYQRQQEQAQGYLERAKASLASEKESLRARGVKPQSYRSDYFYRQYSDEVKNWTGQVAEFQREIDHALDEAVSLERFGLTRAQYEAAERARDAARKDVTYRDDIGALTVDESYAVKNVNIDGAVDQAGKSWDAEAVASSTRDSLYEALDLLPENVRTHMLGTRYRVAVNSDAQDIGAAAFTHAGRSFQPAGRLSVWVQPRWTGGAFGRKLQTSTLEAGGELVGFPGVSEGAETFLHEIGHMVDRLDTDEVLGLFERVTLASGTDKELLSGYGRTKAREMVAETFVRWVRGDTDEVVQMVAESQRWASL